ncbi:FliI/YscN family ATPase [Ottowia oryzae]|uniref:Flagellum-specific ATP synthase FliI n=1 Tax=Ottowia oryzae TaxID=2109914 RepID=A0A2S0MIT7_9BURK|nr:FliI/YscN family ATPase [Ottowia oryzae]AVO35799.1 flagellum-specific ATP synthase FliI [Ottowia oryzae]
MSTPPARPLLDPRLLDTLQALQPAVARGRVVQALGTTLRVSGLRAHIGQQCLIRDPARPQATPLRAEVVGLREHEAILVPLGHLQGVSMGAEVEIIERGALVPVGQGLLGRVLDAFGEPLDGQPLPANTALRPFQSEPPNPLTRRPVEQPFITGVRAIDGLLTVGEGQRLGVFAMAGGGKSTLLGMLARQAQSDVNVIALVGERGREVREFLEDSLGPEGMARSVVVVSTSDRPAMERLRAAQTATAIAESFRAQGQRVLLMMDSVTRYARALREIGLSVGEPAVRRGFPPSVFAELPRLFERAGNDAHGSITAFYTVLAEDEDGSDPVAEETRSILDGHIVLSRQLGQAGHYPAIDVLASASRVFNRVTGPDHQEAALRVRALMAKHEEIRFLLQVGEYAPGSDRLADDAIAAQPALQALLRQRPDEASDIGHTLSLLGQFA